MNTTATMIKNIAVTLLISSWPSMNPKPVTILRTHSKSIYPVMIMYGQAASLVHS